MHRGSYVPLLATPWSIRNVTNAVPLDCKACPTSIQPCPVHLSLWCVQRRSARPGSFQVATSTVAQTAVWSTARQVVSSPQSMILHAYITHPLVAILVRNQNSRYRWHSMLGGFLGTWRRFGGFGEYLAEDQVFLMVRHLLCRSISY